MNLGLIGAIGGLGSGASQVGKKYMDDDSQKERDERLYAQQADLEAKRQAFQERLQMNSQEFHRGENEAGRAFTRDQNSEMRAHAAKLQQQGFTHAEAMAEAQRAMQLKIAGMHEAGANRRHRESQQTARDSQGALMTGEDGTVSRVTGTTATQVTTEGGAPGERVPFKAAPKPRETDYAGLSKAIETINEELAGMEPNDPNRRAREIERDSLRSQMLGRGGPAGSGTPGSGTASIVAGAATPASASARAKSVSRQELEKMSDGELRALSYNNPMAKEVWDRRQRSQSGRTNDGNLDSGQ